ncbi:hypothetical protein DEO23_10130 [Brachybacterium endophyticum]|uniref:Uncharacterized protein n=2 Tax=Brachybacterium endophyticum TaxID=2182385 RepID=A0A2U2RK46_9MICO|nr:hypothetical protein DEO23_10130 [Brachybacterium endophyticum]
MTPAEVLAKLSAVGLESPLRSLAVGGIAYVGGLLMSGLAIILAVAALALSLSGGADSAVESELDSSGVDTEGTLNSIAAFLRAPFQLVAMAMFGSLGTHATIEGATFDAAIRFLPVPVTVVMLLLAFFGGRRIQRGRDTGLLGIWTSAVITGFATALVTVLLALILAQPIPITDGYGLRVHASGFDTFFGAFVLITLALGLGRTSRRSRPAWWPVVGDLPAAFKLAVVHAIVISVAVGALLVVVGSIRQLLDGENPTVLATILLLPLLGGQLLGGLTGLPLLSSLTAKAGLPELAYEFVPEGIPTFRETVFSLPWYVWLLTLLLGLVVLVVVSLPWHHGRRIVPGNIIALAISWVALPFAYLLSGVVLLVISRLSMSFRVEADFFGSQQGTGSFGLAGWTPALALLAGIVVELLSRFVAPFLVPALPRRSLSWFRRPLAAPAATAATPAGTSASAPGAAPAGAMAAGAASAGAAATAPVGGFGPSSGAQRRPLSRRARRTVIGVVAGVGGLCVVIAGAVIAYAVVSRTVYAPDKSVDAYLSALEDGDASGAVELAPPNVPTAQQKLLTDDIAGAADTRISGHEITGSDRQEDGSVLVTADITQDGVTSEQTYTVEKHGRTGVVFPAWRLGAVEYPSVALSVPEGAGTVLVNDTELDVSDLDVSEGFAMLSVLPGTYEFSLPSTSEFISATPSDVSVPVDPMSSEELYAAPTYELSEAGTKEVQSQVNADLDECAKSTDPEPEGCPMSAYVYEPVEDSGSWSIDEYPTVTVDQDGESWSFDTGFDGAGSATYSYKEKPFMDGDKATSETEEASISLYGTVGIDDEGKIQLEYSTW